MGSQKLFLKTGGFSSYLYHTIEKPIVSSNGIVGKVVEKIDGSSFDGLPVFSNTSEVYFKKDNSGKIVQARVFKNRKPVCDFDWNHEHTNKKTKEVFNDGVVHVQEWRQNSIGEWKRDRYKARYMTPKEIEKYGELIKLANPDAILTP